MTLQMTREYENSHTVDEDVVRALAATNNIKIEKTNRKERMKVCTLFEEIAEDTNLPIETILQLQRQEKMQFIKIAFLNKLYYYRIGKIR